MPPETLFRLANLLALLGWAALLLGLLTRREWLRVGVAGRAVPLLLAGWVHYLAFDLLVGGWIAGEVLRRGLPRALLVPALPLTFLFGPLGLLVFAVGAWLLPRRSAAASS